MKIFGLGMPELVIILLLALLIFGPKNLPQLGSALGRTVKNLRAGMGKATEGIEDEESAEEAQPVRKKKAAKKREDAPAGDAPVEDLTQE